MAIKYLCPHCKSDQVKARAEVVWDCDLQSWRSDSYLGGGYCSNCGKEEIEEFDTVLFTPYAPTAAEVKKLRAITGCGMHACKNALLRTKGDFEQARK